MARSVVCEGLPVPPLYFLHVPKTAGTSFRLGAQQYFGAERMVYDYGNGSDTTSRVVRDCLYGERADVWQLFQACDDAHVAMLAGHPTATRHAPAFGVPHTVSFVREPMQRMISEHLHFLRHHDYQGNFRDFCSRPAARDRQSRALRGMPLESIGLLGITERYAESLKMFNARYACDIPLRENNRIREKLDERHEISPDDEQLFRRLNQRDMALYARACALFETRWSLFRQQLPYAHARLTDVDPRHVAGWAWWESGGDAPVDVEVWVNGECVGAAAAVELRGRLCRLRPPRGGHVGFRLPVKLAPGDTVQCKVADTGQVFPPEPRTVTA